MTDVCLFAHFDVQGTVDDYVKRYLRILKELSFSTVLISTSPLSADAQREIAPFCADIMLRPNAGLDFASWRDGLQKHGDAVTGRLLLANDSVYGPIGDVHAALRRLTAQPYDFYGMAESLDVAPHLQSWFLLFENHVAQSAAFRNVLFQDFESFAKPEIIRKGEVGLSVALNKAGFVYRALYRPGRSGPVARNIPFNPTYYLWRELIENEGVPFLKVAVARDRLSAEDIRDVVQPRAGELADMILAHQARVRLPPQTFGRAHEIFWRFIKTDYAANRQGATIAQWTNFALCAGLRSAWLLKRRMLQI
jgi:lipopolysaccharide biosynthesis protein